MRDGVIVAVIGLGLLLARVPWRTTLLILVIAVAVTVLVDAAISELIAEG